MTTSPPPSALFNSDVETAIRVLVVLDAMHPRRCNIAELTWFDYVVVNSGQFDSGPPSLHPVSDVVTGELLVRRHTIQRGLMLLQLQHLVDESYEPKGITYSAGEETPPFLDRLTALYHQQLKVRASWLAGSFGAMVSEQIETEIEAAIGRWTAHLQTQSFPTGVHP
jgi:hypothetical protein